MAGGDGAVSLVFNGPQSDRQGARRQNSKTGGYVTVTVQLAACSQGSQTCLKVQKISAELHPAKSWFGSLLPITIGTALTHVSVQLSAQSVAKSDSGTSKLLWHDFRSIQPRCSQTIKLQQGNADDNYHRCI